MNIGTNPKRNLSIAPLHYPWSGTEILEFYATVAKQTEISRVYLGEIICAKRMPLFQKYLPQIIETLTKAGKQVIISTPILHNDSESHALMLSNIELAKQHGLMVELNDLAGLKHLAGTKFIIGPYLNTYNQGTMAVFARNGAIMLCPPFECNRTVLADLAQNSLPLEVTIFGHLPLSISSRCFIARNLHVERDDCKLACMKQSTILTAASNQDELFSINGMQVQSAKIYNLIAELPDLISLGVHNFRITPTENFSIETLVQQINAAINGESIAGFIQQHQDKFANGFYHNQEGYRYTSNEPI